MRASVLTLASLILILAGCGGGGGGGDDGNGSASGTPPDVSVPSSESTSSPTLVVTPVGSDPDGDSLTWSWSIGNPSTTKAVLIAGDSGTGEVTFTFPKNGTYTVLVTADDGNGNEVTEAVEVTVNDADSFSIDGEVSDDGSAKSGLACELFFEPVGESEVVDSKTTNGSGAFQFIDLIGDKDQFVVLVPGS